MRFSPFTLAASVALSLAAAQSAHAQHAALDARIAQLAAQEESKVIA